MFTDGVDYLSLTAQLVFDQTNFKDSLCTNVTILVDDISENTELFLVRLQSFTQGVIISPDTAIIRITDTDGKQDSK